MKTFLVLSALLFSTVTLAGKGHGHSHGPHAHAISKEKTKEIGLAKIKEFITKGTKKGAKLDASWNKSTYLNSEKKMFSGHQEWVVSFRNEKGVKGKTLYIFLKLSGDFIAVNFTGK